MIPLSQTAFFVRVNGEPLSVPGACTLADLVAQLQQPPQALATAVNGHFIARQQRHLHHLQPGDDVFTFQPITGG